ncbi:MAG: DevR family CRISPR-associated autoregulator [Nitrososphaerota archaeon]|jgi:CRISPR-associated protein Cst2|nr:DevR family CRISPR-associated autoregulator [Nitrososphaerota archaeon]
MSTIKKLTHVAGTFLIEAPASFLNGAGLGDGENRNVTLPKTFRDGRDRVPYVSAQSWRRWLRNTLIEETNWEPSVLRSLTVSAKGTTNKIGGEFNPIDFPEDDIFGYMRAASNKKRQSDIEDGESEEDEVEHSGRKVKTLIRASPFSSSILCSVRKSGWQGRDEGFVHLKEGTPLPYTTEFYCTHLEGVFSLNYMRLGVFWNIGDRVELDEAKVDDFLKCGKIEVIKEEGKSGKIYESTNAADKRKERTSALLNALAHLRGGAKQAAFGTDVSPKVLILAGVTCGNPMFNSLFVDDGNGPYLKVDTLKEIAKDYADRIVTPIFIGIRKGYLKNESDVLQLNGEVSGVTFKILTPIESAKEMATVLS